MQFVSPRSRERMTRQTTRFAFAGLSALFGAAAWLVVFHEPHARTAAPGGETTHAPAALPARVDGAQALAIGPADTPAAQRAARARARVDAKRTRLACAAEAGTLNRFDQPQEAMDYFLSQRLAPGMTELPLEHLRGELELIRDRELVQNAFRGGPPPGGVTGWSEIGPRNIGGRTRAIVINPVDPNVMYAAGVAGGVWKSLDAGATWDNTDDLMLNIAVCCLAMDPTNPNILYAGTGEGFFNADGVRGLGIFKTVDAGATWVQLAGTVDGSVPFGAFFRCNDIVISPTNPSRVYAATRYGVWRSTDAGVSWTLLLANPSFTGGPFLSNGSSAGCTDLAITDNVAPAGDRLLAAFGTQDADGLFRSTDSGATWAAVGTGADINVFNQGRMALAIAPSAPTTMYVCMADNGLGANRGTLVNVFRSLDGGVTWSPRVNLGSLTGPWLLSNLVFATGCAGSSNFAQGWYDNVIAVDPLDADRVWVGGVDLFRSDDGGVNFGIASYWYFTPGDSVYTHADQHAITFHPNYNGTTNQIMYVGNDGGVHRTDNARAATSQEDCPFPEDEPLPAIVWQERNSGYGVTQFYHGDSAADRDAFGGGTQDNGTLLVESAATPENWLRIFGGDGGYYAFDHTDSQIIYAETQNFPNMIKSTDGGASFFDATSGITDSDGLFITPFAMDPNNPLVLWTGGTRVWRTTNGAASWSLAQGGGDPFPNASRISAIAIAPSDSNVVYLGFSNGPVARSVNALAGTPTWTEFTGANGLPAGAVSSVAVDPTNPNVAYCTYSTFGVPHVFRTSNGGTTWTSIDGGVAFAGVPEVPAHWIAVRPCNNSQLYLGTELGVFVSDDTGSTWSPANTGLAHTVVESLDFQDSDTLVAFTHGRGSFRTHLVTCGPDCNTNTTDDALDIAASASADCNTNGTPDECEADCDTNGTPDQCQPGADCNTNGTPDYCDSPADCNTNGTLDECESGRDCNSNGVPDACDASDCNTNGVPDDCDLAGGVLQDRNGNGAGDACEGLGDIDLSGIIDGADVNLFVAVMLKLNTDPPTTARCDINGDDSADADDVAPFVDILVNGP